MTQLPSFLKFDKPPATSRDLAQRFEEIDTPIRPPTDIQLPATTTPQPPATQALTVVQDPQTPSTQSQKLSSLQQRLLRDLAQRFEKSQELTDKQHKAIELLVQGQSNVHVAQQVGVHRGTLWRWRRDDEDFQRSLRAARQHAFDQAVAEIRELVPKSVEVIREKLAEGNQHAALRLLSLCRIGEIES